MEYLLYILAAIFVICAYVIYKKFLKKDDDGSVLTAEKHLAKIQENIEKRQATKQNVTTQTEYIVNREILNEKTKRVAT